MIINIMDVVSHLIFSSFVASRHKLFQFLLLCNIITTFVVCENRNGVKSFQTSISMHLFADLLVKEF